MQSDQEKNQPRKVFQDKSGIRRIVWILIGIVVGTISITWTADFIGRVYTLKPFGALDPAVLRTIESASDKSTAFGSTFEEFVLAELPEPDCARAPDEQTDHAREIFAYLPYGVENAVASFALHCSQIDALLFDAYEFGDFPGIIRPLTGAGVEAPVAQGHASYPIIRPVLTMPDAYIDEVFTNPILRNGFKNGISKIGRETGADGVCIDLSDYPDITPEPLVLLLGALKADPNTAARDTCIIGAVNAGFWSDSAVLDNLDKAVVLAFRENDLPTMPPAPRQWFDQAISDIISRIPEEKLVIALGSFGSLWQSGAVSQTRISYAESMWLAGKYNGEFGFSDVTGNAHIRFLDQQHQLNQIWLLDAVSVFNQLRHIPPSLHIAVWPLGFEDPAIWPLLNTAKDEAESIAIIERPIVLLDQITTVGTGPFISIGQQLVEGRREITTGDPDPEIVNQTYSRLPRPASLVRFGAAPRAELVLTFNGFSSAYINTQILETLAPYGIEATFFLSDMDILKDRNSIETIAAGGHSFGALVPYKGDINWIEESDRQMSANKTQHLLSHITGQYTVLFRDPTARLTEPRTINDFDNLLAMLADGYIPVASGISPPEAAFDRDTFLDQVRTAGISQGVTVLSFDLSIDNTGEVIAALPDMLERLDRDGFGFASLASLTGLDPAILSPAVQPTNSVRDAITYMLLHFWHYGLATVFIILPVIATIRALIYLTLAIIRRPNKYLDPDYKPAVTVLVPAFNEESVIERCIQSILDSDYDNLRVCVIDDGSSDHTAQLVNQKFGMDPRVTLLRQKNAGKWSAENNALHHIDTPIFVGIDADTIIQPNAIAWLVQHFKDETVGAVAGFVEVGNRRGLLTSFQSLEYLVSQSVSRRAYEVFNGILVVPGAIGAWRTEAVRKAGMYSGNTITEDADLTISVLRAGYKVRFQENARAITEAPATIKAFLKQRLRWVLGMMQTSWKHRGAITEWRSVGYISIIDAIWLSLLTSLFSPLVDMLLIGIIIRAIYLLVTQGILGLSGFPLIIFSTYLVLVGIDIVNAIVAFKFERRFDLKLLLLVPLLRFGYRQLMYISSLRAIIRALTGRLVGWNKLSRKGTVKMLSRKTKRPAKTPPAGEAD